MGLRVVRGVRGLPRNDREAAARALGEEFLQANLGGIAEMHALLSLLKVTAST